MKLARTPWCFYSFCYHSGPCSVLPQKNEKKQQSDQVRKTKKEKRLSCQAVLNHFDKQYNKELGNLWTSARTVLLDPQSWQYGIMLNRFSAATDLMLALHSEGFSALPSPHHRPPKLCNTVSSVSNSKQNEAKDHLSSCQYTKRFHEGPNFPPENTSHPLSQDFETKASQTLPHTSLKCYIHPNPKRFISQPHRPGKLKQYYLLNAASLLPVYALQVTDGDKILDLCSAPGGKAVAIMQSATPELLCCNEPDPHRFEWLTKTLESFLPSSLSDRVTLSSRDGQSFGQSEPCFYDKVLVDAPCSNDRSWLFSSNSQQVEQRLKNRAELPALQAQLLRSALSAVRPGGAVVYSTCTLSSLENNAVVETVLKDFPDAEPEDLWEEIAVPLKHHFEFFSHPGHNQLGSDSFPLPDNRTMSTYPSRLGILVIPHPGKTWGPMFLSRIRRKNQGGDF